MDRNVGHAGRHGDLDAEVLEGRGFQPDAVAGEPRATIVVERRRHEQPVGLSELERGEGRRRADAVQYPEDGG
jgi:hypothetical protein